MEQLEHKMNNLIVCFLVLMFSSIAAFGAEYTVSSDDEFNNLDLVAGDIVTWLDGTYSDQEIKWSGQTGTASSPIFLKAETPGGVVFTGTSKINFYGSYLIVDGFYWKGGNGESDHIEFRRGGSDSDFGMNCTIRNCAFDNLFTQEPNKSRWIVLHGSGNVVENCSFINKLSAGAAILVELSYTGSLTPGHVIRNNYFYNITPKDAFSTNSGDCEAIRIGVSSDQSVSAQVLVEGNYFQAADGENEIITNKSADNIYLHNTFRNCRGSLVLRHGARAHIEGNFFLGEGKPKSGGIRISDRDHVIINNYMQGLNNDNDIWNNGITLVGGGESSGGSGNGYQNVDNVTIAYNTIYNSDDPIFFNDRNSHDPTGVIAYNLIYSENGDIVAGDISGTGQGMSYEGNIFGGSDIGITDGGITVGIETFSASGEIFKPISAGLAANAAGSAYSDIVNIDVEGIARPNVDLDVGAHEVSGGSGVATYSPITDGIVGAGVGACFLNAAGNVLSECGAVGDYLTVSTVSDFSDLGGTLSARITTNVDWTLSVHDSWISVDPISGSGSQNIDITTLVNPSTSERTGLITVSASDISDRTISVTQSGYVAPIDVTSVSLMPEILTIGVGGIQQLLVAIAPSDASNQSVSFNSDNLSVAEIDPSGMVTAVAVGTATIMVITEDGDFTDVSVVNVIAPSTGTNVALNKPSTATGTPDGDNVPQNLVDGDPDSRWAVEGFPQSATVDLVNVYSIDGIEVIAYNDRAYQYVVEGSIDGNSFTTIVDRSNNTTPGTNTSPIANTFLAVEARYVKITVSGAAEYTGPWVSLDELIVLGDAENNPILVSGVVLSPNGLSLIEGKTGQLTAIVSPTYATDQGISYATSNPSVATVNSVGLVSAVSEGTATITVTTDDGSFTDSIEILVSSVNPVVLDVNEESVEFSPNPAISLVNISGTGDYHTLIVYDHIGRVVTKQTIGSLGSVDISTFQKGIYIFKLVGIEESFVGRVIKQ